MDEADLGEVQSVEHIWGTEEVFADVQGRLVGKVLHVRSGAHLALQIHADGEEVISLMSGSVVLELGDAGSLIPMMPGQTVHIQGGTPHLIRADKDSMLLQVSSAHPAREADT